MLRTLTWGRGLKQAVLTAIVMGLPVAAHAQLHGGTILKACTPKVLAGGQATCTIRVVNADGFGHALQVNSIVDTVNHLAGPVATPNLLAAPVVLTAAGDGTDVNHTFTVTNPDNDPLSDLAVATGTDLGTGLAFTLTVGRSIDIVECFVNGDCLDDGNPCTTEVCSNNVCTHPAGNAGTVCRPANGVCDLPEQCTGTSTQCPTDGFASSTTVCRASAGVCDVAENCPGNGPNCPANTFLP